MTIDGQKPLQVGQVLEGLLDGAISAAGGEPAMPVVDEATGRSASAAALPVTLWERMMAAVDLKFDGDNDGDVGGKG